MTKCATRGWHSPTTVDGGWYESGWRGLVEVCYDCGCPIGDDTPIDPDGYRAWSGASWLVMEAGAMREFAFDEVCRAADAMHDLLIWLACGGGRWLEASWGDGSSLGARGWWEPGP